jgi:manganese oxidase
MNKKLFSIICLIPLMAVFFLLWSAGGAFAGHTGIDGITGQTEFNFTAKTDYITTGDGGNYLIWGYADIDDVEMFKGQRAQYPAPTIIVTQGETITVNLTNNLSEPVSIIFPGQSGVTATAVTASTQDGVLTKEALPGGTVQYQFVASQPGTYMYHSGSNMQLQLEMGLLGALIVRPSLGVNYAYNSAATRWDREYLFLLTDMDPRVHDAVEFGNMAQAATYLTERFPVYWFINGRAAPDNMAEPYVGWLPTQPYNIMPRMHPGERLLMRVIGGGFDLHPYHHHGHHADIIAVDGRMLSSTGASPDLAESVFTIKSVPGQTVDAIFTWTGEKLGWDIYGTPLDGRPAHDCKDTVNNVTGLPGADGYADMDAVYPWEYCEDHGKPFPTVLPEKQDLAFGGWYGGSPFLGASGDLPPGEGGLNPFGGFSYMWHSHTEKELTNWDIFPGGMLTMLIIEGWNVDIP